MIVCCGEALVDVVAGTAPEGSASPASPVAVPGGGPLNVAVAAARLGATSAFVGRVSTDSYGEQIWRFLQANNVSTAACERGPEPTARAIVEHIPKLAFRFEGTHTADTKLTTADLTVLGDEPHTLFGGTLGMFRGQTAATLAELAETHQGLVAFSPNVRPQLITDRSAWNAFHERWRTQAHIYFASDEDLAWIWPKRTASACAAELLDDAAPSRQTGSSRLAVFVTHGEQGATLFLADTQIKVPGIAVSVVDTVGAGDAFAGAVLAGLYTANQPGATQLASDTARNISPSQWEEFTQRAVQAAALTCTRPGADPPTTAELAAFAQDQPADSEQAP